MAVMLLEWVVTSVFLILVVLALRAALGKRMSAGLRYALWAAVLVRLLAPVQLFALPVAGTWVTTEKRTVRDVTQWPITSAGADDALSLGESGLSEGLTTFPQAPDPPTVPDAPEPPDLSNPPGWLVNLGWTWLAGAAAAALVLLLSNLRFYWKLRRERVPLETADCPLRVYVAVGLPSPCLFGLVRPAVYVTPEAAADPDMLRHVLAHEYTHFRHGDHVWSLLRCAALAVHWWNPLVWVSAVLSQRDAELACDEGALKRLGGGERAGYGGTLLALVTAKPRPGDLFRCATTMVGDKKSLKERVSRIAKAPKRILWVAVAAVAVMVLACVCAFGQAEPETEGGPEPDPSPLVSAEGDESRDAEESEAPADGLEEPRVLEYHPDLNRNGVPEELRVGVADWGSGQKLEVWEDGELLYEEDGDFVHAGYNALFLYQDGDGDYLLRYNPYMGQGWGVYSYRLFTLNESGASTARYVDLEFDINFIPAMHESFDPEAIAAFMDEINGLLANSVQLINTDADLLSTFEKTGRLYDDLGFLDWAEGDFTRDPSKSLLENLRDYQEAMEAEWDDPWGLYLNAGSATPTGLILNFVQGGGAPTGELIYGSRYWLEREDGGAWSEVPNILDPGTNLAWTDEAYSIPMHNWASQEVDWSWLYGELPAGHYRIAKDVMDWRAPGDFDTRTYYAEFSVS